MIGMDAVIEKLKEELNIEKDRPADADHLDRFLKWLFQNFEELDERAKEFAEGIFDNIKANAKEFVSNITDPIEKRRAERRIAIAEGKHFDVGQFLYMLDRPSSHENEALKYAIETAEGLLQKYFDLVYDVSNQTGKDNLELSSNALLLSCVDELMIAIHLANHKYFLQANNHIRAAMETIDLILAFHKDAALFHIWLSGDKKEVRRRLSPSNIRKKLGRDKFDPLYGLLSELGVHPTVQSIVAKIENDGISADTGNALRIINIGGSKDLFLLHTTSQSILLVLSSLFVGISKLGYPWLDENEILEFARESSMALEQFHVAFYRPFLVEIGIDVKEMDEAMERMSNSIRGPGAKHG